jgi:hypothetical protein
VAVRTFGGAKVGRDVEVGRAVDAGRVGERVAAGSAFAEVALGCLVGVDVRMAGAFGVGDAALQADKRKTKQPKAMIVFMRRTPKCWILASWYPIGAMSS